MSFSNQPQYNRSRFGFPFERVIQTPASGTAYTSTITRTITLSNAITNLKSGLIEKYSEENANPIAGDTSDRLSSVANVGIGQSFTGIAKSFDKSVFYLAKNGSPTGNIVSKLYTGFDDGGIIPDTLLATSNTIDVSTFSTLRALVKFTFATPYLMTASNSYVTTIEYSGGDASNYIIFGVGTTGTPASGILSYNLGGGWSPDDTVDVCFYAYAQ